jgi:hypothetical protein
VPTVQAITLAQGATRTIVISGIVDANGVALDVSTWSVRAQARPAPRSTVLLAEWVSGTPAAGQGQATAAGSEVRLAVPYAMSEPWTFTTAVLQVELTEPGGSGRRERIADIQLVLDPEIVR